MKGEENRQDDFLSHAIYDSMNPSDHLFHRLRKLLDWNQLASVLDDCYRHKGRASMPPEVML